MRIFQLGGSIAPFAPAAPTAPTTPTTPGTLALFTLGLSLFFALFLSLFLAPASLLARPLSPEERFRLEMANDLKTRLEKPAPAAGDGSGVVVALVPFYHHIRHGDLRATLGGTRLKSRSGVSRVGGAVLTATKPINEYFTFGWIYQYAFGEYEGGLLVPDLPALDGRSQIDVSSHMTGLFGDIFLGSAGRLNVSFFVAWDSFSGQETTFSPAGPDRRNLERNDARLGSVTLWWDKDLPLGETWTVSPYLGWRSIRACLRGQTVWTAPVGVTATQNAWSHLISGGVTVKRSGAVDLKFWAGYNRRTQKSPIPGFASRALAPGIANLGWMNAWDQDVLAYGLALSRPIATGVALDLSYNGHYGRETLAQGANLAVVWIF